MKIHRLHGSTGAEEIPEGIPRASGLRARGMVTGCAPPWRVGEGSRTRLGEGLPGSPGLACLHATSLWSAEESGWVHQYIQLWGAGPELQEQHHNEEAGPQRDRMLRGASLLASSSGSGSHPA